MNQGNFKSSPKQERIYFDVYSNAEKENNSKRGVSFTYATREDELKAMRLLKGDGNAFLLWRYWLHNVSMKDKLESYWISPQAIENNIGLTKSMYKTAKDSLISHGFLTWDGKAWTFHATPKEASPKPNKERDKAVNDMLSDLAEWMEHGMSCTKVQTNTVKPQMNKCNDIESNDFDGDVPDFDFEY